MSPGYGFIYWPIRGDNSGGEDEIVEGEVSLPSKKKWVNKKKVGGKQYVWHTPTNSE